MLALVDEVVVDLVREHQHAPGPAQGHELLEQLPRIDRARGVVRRVHDEQARAVGDRVRHPRRVRQEVRRLHRHAHVPAAGQGDRGGVRVVERLDRDDLVARAHERQDRRGDALGGTRGDHGLRGGVLRHAPVAPAVLRDGLPQHGVARAGGVLVGARQHGVGRQAQQRVGAVGVGEALAEVHGPVLDGEARHRLEHGGHGAGVAEQARGRRRATPRRVHVDVVPCRSGGGLGSVHGRTVPIVADRTRRRMPRPSRP
ncbi:Uncharacterised protein [Streptococcus pneumoniae]|nr:Uncharacterised protein [Streptococcus pneumoniae]